MRLAKCDLNVLGTRGYKVSNNLKIIEEFVDSGMDIMEVLDYTQNDAACCAGSLNASIKRYNKGGITAISRKEHVYLVKKSCFKKSK